jgi:putative hemolysin
MLASGAFRAFSEAMLYVEILVVLILIAINGFLAMSELAVVSSRRARLQTLLAEGYRGAEAALTLLDNQGRFLSSVQIGITLVGIFAGVFSGATLAERFAVFLAEAGIGPAFADPLAFGIVVVAITYITLIAGELVPKQIALRRPNRTAAAVAPAMVVVARIAAPAVWLLDVSSRLILRLLKSHVPVKPLITEDEIKMLVAEAETAGVVEPEERSMIARVMRLGDKPVRTIMTPRHEIEWIDLSATDQEIRESLRRVPHSRLPAARGSLDEIVGVIRGRRVLNELLAGHAPDFVACVDQVPHVSEHMTALEAIDVLRESPARMVFVFDEYGNLEGIVTEGDILRAIAGHLVEEPHEMPSATKRQDGSWLIDGAMSVEEAADRLKFKPPISRDFHTLAGFVLHELEHVPDVGDVLEYQGWRFEIADMDGRRIDKLLAIPPQVPPRRLPKF